MALDSNPTSWEPTTIDALVASSSDASEWLTTKIDPLGSWSESDPTGWVVTSITEEGRATSDPTDWVTTTVAALPSSGMYVVDAGDHLVEVWGFDPAEL